jgi:hypothetical protein
MKRCCVLIKKIYYCMSPHTGLNQSVTSCNELKTKPRQHAAVKKNIQSKDENHEKGYTGNTTPTIRWTLDEISAVGLWVTNHSPPGRGHVLV